MFFPLALQSSNNLKPNNTLRKPIRLGNQNSPVRVCRFAHHHYQLIAVGYDTGVIEVYLNFKKKILYLPLKSYMVY